MRLLRAAMGTVMLSLAASAWADTGCQGDDATIRAFSQSAAEDYIRRQLSQEHYTCAVEALRGQAILRSSLDGLDGWDSRFALRELAQEAAGSESYSAPLKVELFAAVVSPSLDPGNAARRVEDMVADSHMLLHAITGTSCDARFELLSLAARINRKLPAEKRDREISIVNSSAGLCASSEAQGFEGIEALLKLVSDTQGIPEFAEWRANLACDIRFKMTPDTIPHAQQELRLIDALSDVHVSMCSNAKFDWRWPPIYEVARYYHRQQLPQESAVALHRALDMIRALSDPVDKLTQFREVCSSMQRDRFPDAEYLPVVNEMKPLAAMQGNVELLVRLQTDNCVPPGWADRAHLKPAPVTH